MDASRDDTPEKPDFSTPLRKDYRTYHRRSRIRIKKKLVFGSDSAESSTPYQVPNNSSVPASSNLASNHPPKVQNLDDVISDPPSEKTTPMEVSVPVTDSDSDDGSSVSEIDMDECFLSFPNPNQMLLDENSDEEFFDADELLIFPNFDDILNRIHASTSKQSEPTPSPPHDESTSESSESSEGSGDENEESTGESTNLVAILRAILCVWALQFNINHVQLTGLLKALRSIPEFAKLPACSKTILKTPRSVSIDEIEGGGSYYHFGLEKCLKELLKEEKSSQKVELLVSVDGVPISKSSGKQIWPILCSIQSIKKLRHIVFPIGFYYCTAKPTCPAFIARFVDEAVKLLKFGVSVGKFLFPVSISGIVCDAPAKALLQGTLNHNGNGKAPCTYCKIYGRWFKHRVTFADSSTSEESDPEENPETEIPLRTHEEFLNRSDKYYYKKTTPLLKLSEFIDLVKIFVIDIMHVVYQGVVKKTLRLLVKGKKVDGKLAAREVRQISKKLLAMKPWFPVEYNRKPRELEDVKQYKATEMRSTLLNTFIVASKGILSEEKYKNFLSLSVAMRILLSSEYSNNEEWRSFASELITYYVQSFSKEYGSQFISYNFHCLSHLVKHLDDFPDIEEFSAFKFENFLRFVLKLIRQGSFRALPQLAKRMEELYINDMLLNQKRKRYTDEVEFLHPHNDFSNQHCSTQQYHTMNYKHFTLTSKKPNNCCELLDSSIVLISNICYHDELEVMGVTGFKYRTAVDYFSEPCRSSDIGIYQVSNLDSTEQFWPLSQLKAKMVHLPNDDESFVAQRMTETLF